MNVAEMFDRVALWNDRRYKRVYNHELSMALLKEEHQEWLDAEKPVDKLDALCDLIFVATGIIWKLNVNNPEEYNENAYTDVSNLLDANALMPGYILGAVINTVDKDSNYIIHYGMHVITYLAFCEMTALGLKRKEILEAINIVCDSNDSKSIHRTPSNVKANKDKGSFFVPPEPRLQALLERVNGRLN